MDDRLKIFFKSLTGLVESITVLNTLLRDDLNYFSLNQVDQLLASNKQKHVVLHNVAGFTHELQKLIPHAENGLIHAVRNHIQALPHPYHAKATKLLDRLQIALTEGSQNLVTNNHVIMANLNQIKCIWDRLSPLSMEKNSVYEKPKQVESK